MTRDSSQALGQEHEYRLLIQRETFTHHTAVRRHLAVQVRLEERDCFIYVLNVWGNGGSVEIFYTSRNEQLLLASIKAQTIDNK